MIRNWAILLVSLLVIGICHGQFLTPSVDTVLVRDGKKIPVDVYVPGPGTWPVVLIQTPYNRLFFRGGLPLGVGINLPASPYAFVVSDWRGFYGAAAAASPGYDRGLDGYDIIQWITSQSFSNGKVATWGPSALGKIQYETAKHHPPGLVALVPLVAGTQMSYHDYYPGGAYRKEYVEQLDALGYCLSTIIEAHPLKDIFWNYADTVYMYPERIQTPTLMIGGWYDHNVGVMLQLFDSLRLHGPAGNRDSIYLMMGPWAHGGHGTAYVGTVNQGSLLFTAAAGWPDSLANLFLSHFLLRSSSVWLSQPRVWSFQMGENIWNGLGSLPNTASDSLVLYGISADSLAGNTSGLPSTAVFNSDPHLPSPTIGGPTLRADLLQGPYDQSGVVSGGNGLILNSELLSSPVQVFGRIKVSIPFTATTPDADLCIRVADVDPAGDSAYLLVDAVQRLRFRNTYTTMNDTLVPGVPYTVEIPFPFTAHTFMPGHRIQLIITGSNYPRFDLNLQNSNPLYTGGDTLISTFSLPVNAPSGLRMILPLLSSTSGFSNDISSTESLVIYPNPTRDQCIISIPGKGVPVHMNIYSTDGRIHHLDWDATSDGIRIDISGLPPGLFLVTMTDDRGITRFGRVVKE